jgi:hypothetical protein
VYLKGKKLMKGCIASGKKSMGSIPPEKRTNMPYFIN